MALCIPNRTHFFRRSHTEKEDKSATARKLGVIRNMVTRKQPYNPPTHYLFLAEKKAWLGQKNQKANKFDIKPEEVGFVRTSISAT
jgi:hypothetical protein